MGNTFFKKYFSIFDLGSEKAAGSGTAASSSIIKQRIGLVGGILPPQDFKAGGDGYAYANIYIFLAAITVAFCALVVAFLIICRTCCSKKKIHYSCPIDLPVIQTVAPKPAPVYVRPPPKIVREEVIEESGDLWCERCGLYHADMKHVTMANLKDIDLEGLDEIKRRTEIVREYKGDATFERHGNKNNSW